MQGTFVRRKTCLLCGRELEQIDQLGNQRHPDVEDCQVVYTDAWGISIELDPPEEIIEEAIATLPDGEEPILFQTFPFVEDCLRELYAESGLRFLGGASTGRGWSSYKTFERCWYLWKRRYIEQAKPHIIIESPGRAVGTLVHAFLALYYTGKMADDNPYKVLEPELVYERLIGKCNPELLQEGWRIFCAYRLYYSLETAIIPLAVEYDLKHPRTNESCRFDLIAWLDEPIGELIEGTYNIEHKTGKIFDRNFLEGWQNDGEVLGQNALWNELSLDKRFGTMRGTIVNLIGKQKEPKFHRTFVARDSWRIKSHLDDLQKIDGLIALARATDTFPRMRGNCIDQYGMCDWYGHCASGEAC